MRRHVSSLFWTVPVLVALAIVPPSAAIAQSSTDAGPRFLLASSDRAALVPIDISRSPVLKKRLTLDLDGVSVKDALAAISRESGIRIFYVDNLIANAQPKKMRAEGITVAAALTDVLSDLDVDVVFSRDGSATIVKRDRSIALVQTGTITGTVTEAATGNPVPLAQVSVRATSRTHTTNDSGRYVIAGVPAGTHTVAVRRLGYDLMSREVTVPDGGSVTADFALVGSTARLAEIVATATGGQRRMELGNAIARIDAESLAITAPIRSLNDLLMARAAGVQVFAPDGISGQAGRIRVRGINSFSVSNDPLVLIDGVRVEASSSRTSQSANAGGRLADINPDEIASVDIVKGPSAATLYGTDAANGVILITTHRGQSGQPRYNVYVEQGVVKADASRYPTNWYAFGRNTTTGAAGQCVLLQVAVGACVQDSVSSWNALLQSASSPLGTGHRQVYGAQASGSVAALTYFLSGEYEEEKGYLRMPKGEQAFLATLRGSPPLPEQIRPNAIEKTSLRANVSVPVGNRADLALSTGLVLNETRLPNSQVSVGQRIGRGVRGTDDPGITAEWAGRRPAAIFGQVNTQDVTRSTSGLTASYRPLAWLASRATIGLDVVSNRGTSLSRRSDRVLFEETGRRVNGAVDLALYSVDLSAVATHALTPVLSSRSAIGGQYNRRREEATTVTATGLALGAETVAGAQFVSGTEATTETVVAGTFLEQTFGFRDRLFIIGAVRLDGASSFGTNFKTAAYPKASVSWLAIDGGARGTQWKRSSLRLRAAYGSSGVQPGPTSALATNILLTGLVNGASVNAAVIGALGNPDLKPERQTELETGVDAEWLTGRVRFEGTFYQRESRDALVNLTWAPELGVTGVHEVNIGSVRNRGAEWNLNTQVLKDRALTLDFALSGSHNTNTLFTLGEGVLPIQTPFGGRHVPGYPLFGYWDRPILSYMDANGDGILGASEVVVGDTAVYLGSQVPKQQLTTSLTIGLLNDQLRVTGLGEYRGGFVRNDLSGRCRFFANCRAVNDPSTPLDQQAAAVALNAYGTGAGVSYDASFFRLREIGLTYVLPERLAQRVSARRIAITVTARNLFLTSNYPGMDPEGQFNPVSDDFVQEVNVLPGPRYFLLRVTAGL